MHKVWVEVPKLMHWLCICVLFQERSHLLATCVIWGLFSATTWRDTSVSTVGRSLTSVSGASRYGWICSFATHTHAAFLPFIWMSKHLAFCVFKNFSRTDRLLRHRRLCQGRNVTKVENQPCCDPRPYPQEAPPAPPTWSPLHPPPGRLAVWHSAFPSSTMPPETDQATGSLPRSSVLCDTALGQALILQLHSWDY